MTGTELYRLAPGVETLRLGPDRVALQSGQAFVELAGESAEVFHSQIVRRLDGTHSAAALARAIGLASVDSLRELLDGLVEAGLVVRSPRASGAEQGWLAFLDTIAVDREKSADHLRNTTVAVFGLEGLGHAIAGQLAAAGIGRLTLVDPFPDPSNYGADCPPSRQDSVAKALAGVEGLNVALPSRELNEAAAADAASGANFVVAAYGPRFPAVAHWVNRTCQATGIPALFVEADGAIARIGPLVLPNETACYTCTRMRAIACANAFDAAMMFEEQLSGYTEPRDAAPQIDHVAAIAAGTAVSELLSCMLALAHPSLTNHVLEIDTLRAQWTRHAVVWRPDCPVCSKKKPSSGHDTAKYGTASGRLSDAVPRLVGPRYGLLRDLERVHKDPSEPERPYIVRAKLSNHRFMSEKEDPFVIASGKGLDLESATASALGEALERYAASSWGEDRVVRGSLDRLGDAALDPARLVLFRAEQYSALNYDPFDPAASIGWVAMTDWARSAPRYVPALAVLMAYETAPGEPFLFPITSNGLAAGSTLAAAVLAGAYEVIERDAFLNVWLNRLQCEVYDPLSHPDAAIRSVVLAHARRGVRLELYRAPTDHGISVFLGLARAGPKLDGPAAVVGLGADHDPARAAAKATLEVFQVRPALKVRLRQSAVRARLQILLDDPGQVTALEDHDLLYADRSMLPAFDFLAGSSALAFAKSSPAPEAPEARLDALANTLDRLDTALLYADLTTADVAAFGVAVVRVVIPDFQPMHFGRKERRLAAPRLYALPRRLGLDDRLRAPESLNPLPHPLA